MTKKLLIISNIAFFLLVLFVGSSSFAAVKYDLNKASATDLAKVPGISKDLAKKIVNYRKKNGNFKEVKGLLKVKGVGKVTLKKVKRYLNVTAKPAHSSSRSYKGTKVNINKATAKQLQKLPGVGPKTAKKIIDFRRKNGNFKRPSDIKKIKGIGDKTYQKMKKMIVVK